MRLVAEARGAGEPAALVMALRAEAWFERTRLAHVRARALLDEAIRIARKHQLDSLLGQVGTRLRARRGARWARPRIAGGEPLRRLNVRLLSFEAADICIDLQVVPQAGRRSLLGQVAGVVAQVRVESADGAIPVAVDPHNRFQSEV